MPKEAYTPARKIYALALGLAGYALLIWRLTQTPLDASQWLYTLLLAALALLFGMLGAVLPGDIYLGLEATSYYAAILTLPPVAVGLVALCAPHAHWLRLRGGLTGWAVFRNGGMYAIMGLAGGWVYQMAGGTRPLADLSPLSLVALALALIAIRVLNDLAIVGSELVKKGTRRSARAVLASQRTSWGVEALAYLPALLTALIYTRAGWSGLAVWLLILTAGAAALYQLVQARTELHARLADLGRANAAMGARNDREHTMATRLSQAAEDLAGYAVRLAAALQQQHSAVAEITATVEQLARQAAYIAETANAVDSTAGTALSTADRGRDAASSSVQAMAEVEQNVREMHEHMTALDSRSRLIRRTLQTINSIAGETHLLALNATIEAAGAGERGQRFGVVAQQINLLADQALKAAGEIQTTVREIETATEDTKTVIVRGLTETRRYAGQVDEARQAIDQIVGAAARASAMAQQIRQATEQQTLASSQVTTAMREIVASLGTASAEGVAVSTAAEDLRRMAGELRRVDVQGAPA